jgi:hypothetical protein
VNRNEFIELKVWDIDPENDSEDLSTVMPNLTDITLVGIHRNELSGTYIFSFVSPSEVTGSRADGSSRLYKKIFFCHCVLFENTNDVKIIFNPTSNLQNVNGVRKDRHDWTPIASMFFDKVKEYIGEVYIIAPRWIPQALYEFADEATSHNNPKITAASFNAQEKISKFASAILKEAGIDADLGPALANKLIQDIQISFESQLMEVYSTEEEQENSFICPILWYIYLFLIPAGTNIFVFSSKIPDGRMSHFIINLKLFSYSIFAERSRKLKCPTVKTFIKPLIGNSLIFRIQSIKPFTLQ